MICTICSPWAEPQCREWGEELRNIYSSCTKGSDDISVTSLSSLTVTEPRDYGDDQA